MKPLIAFILFLLAAGPATADTISLRRGLPTDIWLTWPGADRLDEEGLINTFPEYRQQFTGGHGWSTWSWSGSFGMSRTPASRDFSPVLLKALGLGG